MNDYMRAILKSDAFTLSEVLITLAIIGVVAALTIPSLIAKYNKQIYVTQLKKAVSVFDNALGQISADYGTSGDLSTTGIYGGINEQLIVKYFKVAKYCGSAVNLGCFSHSANNAYDGSSTTFNPDGYAQYYKFLTADGAAFGIVPMSADCSTYMEDGSLQTPHFICGEVFIDVNGPNKGPNYVGRDLFVARYNKYGQIYYYGVPGDPNTPKCAASDSYASWYCYNKIVEEGWQMNY